MKQVSLGGSDLQVGALSFGHWRLTEHAEATPDRRVRTALDLGMTLMDTADIYGFTDPVPGSDPDGFGGAEVILGGLIQSDPALRERMVLTTKGGIRPPTPYNSSQAYLTSALEASLTRLNTDYVDLYQIHRPDILTSYAELADVLDGFVATGKVRYLGVSNFTNDQVRALAAHLKNPLITRQPQGSLWHIDPIMDGTFDLCQEQGLTPLIWSPLAGGMLATGQASDPQDRDDLARVISVLDVKAKAYNATRTQIALAFILAHPAGGIPLIGSQKPERLKEAAGAMDVMLTRQDWYDLLVTRRGQPMP